MDDLEKYVTGEGRKCDKKRKETKKNGWLGKLCYMSNYFHAQVVYLKQCHSLSEECH